MLTNNKPSNIVIHYFGREGVSCQGKDSEREGAGCEDGRSDCMSAKNLFNTEGVEKIL